MKLCKIAKGHRLKLAANDARVVSPAFAGHVVRVRSEIEAPHDVMITFVVYGSHRSTP